MSDFAFKQYAVDVAIDSDSIIATMLKNRVNAMSERLANDLNFNLYADRGEPEKLTIRQRLACRLQLYRSRIQDAWLVLTGRAEIGGDW